MARRPYESVEDWKANLRHIYMAAALLQALPLEEMIEKAERAQAVGPLIDPTLWRHAGKAASEDLDILRAARVFAAVWPASRARGTVGAPAPVKALPPAGDADVA